MQQQQPLPRPNSQQQHKPTVSSNTCPRHWGPARSSNTTHDAPQHKPTACRPNSQQQCNRTCSNPRASVAKPRESRTNSRGPFRTTKRVAVALGTLPSAQVQPRRPIHAGPRHHLSTVDPLQCLLPCMRVDPLQPTLFISTRALSLISLWDSLVSIHLRGHYDHWDNSCLFTA